MKISIDDRELFTLTDIQKDVIKNDIHEDIFEDDMKRRIQWVLQHKHERCLKRLKDEWIPKMKNRVESIPTNDDQFAQLVFSQPDYKSKAQMQNEQQALMDAQFKIN